MSKFRNYLNEGPGRKNTKSAKSWSQVEFKEVGGKIILVSLAGIKCKIQTPLDSLPGQASIASTLSNYYGSAVVIASDSKYYEVKDGKMGINPL